MPLDLADLLQRRKPLLADGAWGTELAERAKAPVEIPDALNLAEPETVRAVAAAYVAAGADIVLTNTFGANPWRLGAAGLGEKLAEINRTGARLSREAAAADAAGREVLVFGSIGPAGKMLMMGEVTPEELLAGYGEQAAALAAGGADALVLETFGDLEELRAALEAARKRTDLPVIASLSYDAGSEEEPATMMGVPPAAAAEALGALGDVKPDGIGANCGRGAEAYLEVCRRYAAAWSGPVWIKPNAGLPEVVGGKTVYRQTPEEFAAAAQRLGAAGAAIIGGCCGTTPGHIRALAKALGRP